MTPRDSAPQGLSADELAAATAELQPLLGAIVLDVVPFQVPAGCEDLLLVLSMPGAHREKVFVHICLGNTRARVCTTTRRWPTQAFARGATHDLLQRELAGATLHHVVQPPAERRCIFGFRGERGDRRLAIELFGARGLWVLLDSENRILQMSRAVSTAVRTLQPGDAYAPPPPPPGEPRAEPPARFLPPVLPAIDVFFTQRDRHAETLRELELLQRATARALQRAQQKQQGIAQQLADTGRTTALRELADLMLAYAHTVRRGSTQMTFPDPTTAAPRTIDLDPARSVVAQAQANYEKARRLDDGRAMAERRLADAAAAVTALLPLHAALAALSAATPDLAEQLASLRTTLQGLRVVPTNDAAPKKRKERSAPPGENFRRFLSAEGYTILVGRDNEQNDRLTMRTANGNDVWLHVGGGRPGSHVVVRVPKQKTASLETLLDAAALAVHFSKARGEPRIDVVYTLRKHVRKPKGLPAGAVVPSQTKTITSLRDESRLRRLLDSAGDEAD